MQSMFSQKGGGVRNISIDSDPYTNVVIIGDVEKLYGPLPNLIDTVSPTNENTPDQSTKLFMGRK